MSAVLIWSEPALMLPPWSWFASSRQLSVWALLCWLVVLGLWCLLVLDIAVVAVGVCFGFRCAWIAHFRASSRLGPRARPASQHLALELGSW